MSQLATLSSRFLCHLSSSHSFLTVLAAMCAVFDFRVRSFVFATFGWRWCVMGLFCWKFLWQASSVHRLLGLCCGVGCHSMFIMASALLCPRKSKNSQIAALSLRFMSHFFSVHSLLTVLAAMCFILASTFAALSLLPLGGGGASRACFVGSSCGKPPLSIGCLVICCSVCHFMSIAFFAPDKKLVKMTCSFNMCHNICANKCTRRHIL